MTLRAFFAPSDAKRRIAAYALPVLLLVGLGGWRLRTTAGQFDSWAWQGASYHEPGGPRDVMVNDLVQNHLQSGMTRRQILALLGEPDDDVAGNWFYCVYQDETQELKYHAQFYQVNLMLGFKGELLHEARVVHPRIVYTEPRPPNGTPGFMSLQ